MSCGGLARRPNGSVPDLAFTFTDPPKSLVVKVNLRCETGRCGLIVRAGGQVQWVPYGLLTRRLLER